MSAPIDLQLRDYTEFIEAQMRVIELDEIMELRLGEEPVRPIGPSAHPSILHPRRRWLVALAAAAVTLVLVGSAAFISQSSEPDTPVAETAVPTTRIEAPVPETAVPTTLIEFPTTTAPPSLPWCEGASTWTRVCSDAAGFEGAVITSVTVGGPGLVAVGSSGVLDDELGAGAAVWTSPDGHTWSRVPHDESAFGGLGEPGMWSVTVGGPGLVAVGSADGDAAVWTSPNGFTWSRVPHDESVFGGDFEQGMLGVTVGGPGLVAVGADGTRDDDTHDDAVAAVWTSPDGFTWSRVPHDEAIFGGNGEAVMESVTVGGPGLVAVGWDGIDGGVLGSCCAVRENDDHAVAAVWTSPDGLTWSRVAHDESVFGVDVVQAMFSVTIGGPGLVAVGGTSGIDTGPGSDGAVWTSVDGFTWSRVTHDADVFGGLGGMSQDWMESVTAGGPGLVAVGSSGQVQGVIEEAVWTSPDGITWTRLPQPQHGCYAEMLGVTDGPSGPVAVGFAGCDLEPGTAAVWHD